MENRRNDTAGDFVADGSAVAGSEIKPHDGDHHPTQDLIFVAGGWRNTGQLLREDHLVEFSDGRFNTELRDILLTGEITTEPCPECGQRFHTAKALWSHCCQ